MSYIDILIPFIGGLLLIAHPSLFTKSQGEKFEQAKKRFKTIGILLLVVSFIYLTIKLINPFRP